MTRNAGMPALRPNAALLATTYVIIAWSGLMLAYEVRFDFNILPEYQLERQKLAWLIVAVKLLALLLARQVDCLITYFGVNDLFRIFGALSISEALFLVTRYAGYMQFSPPRGVLLIDLLFSVVGIASFRLGARLLRERLAVGPRSGHRAREKAIIIGAGHSGATLARDLLASPRRALRPIAFLDDDSRKHRKFIHGLPVLGKPEDIATISALSDVRHAIIAMPSAPRKRIAEVAVALGKAGLKVETVPALEDLASGRVKVNHFRPVEIEDLLGRPVIETQNIDLNASIAGKVVVVTGAGGSIGSELCRQIMRSAPRQLLMLEQSEVSLFQFEQELIAEGYSGTAIPIVADVTDRKRLRHVFEVYRPDTVFHAAAHKHVYMMERQPSEAVKNNTLGTKCVAEVAIEHNVSTFVLISTDKAINPTNAMGASKRLAEIYIQSLHAKYNCGPEPSQIHAPDKAEAATPLVSTRHRTKLMAVRFGNVLGSSGSVVPIFKKQIEAGGPVTVTHPDVVRYFMTIPEAVGLVLQSSLLGEGGEIFVLDMGQPVRILDLATNLIELSGLRLNEDIEIKFSGLKPGEKLYEELQHNSENLVGTSHPRIMRFISSSNAEEVSHRADQELEPFLDLLTSNEIKQRLRALIPEYSPYYE